MTIGIYGLFYEKECLYIGQSVNIEGRVKDHLGKLSRGHHGLLDFQTFSDKHGLPEWRILAETTQERLSPTELEFFNTFKPRFFGYTPSAFTSYTYGSRATTTPIICAICATPFLAQGVRAKFCSKSCYYEGRKRQHRCLNCEKLFRTFSTKSDWCSSQCRLDYKKVNRLCLGCSTLFSSNGTKYCSKNCAPKVKHIQTCVVCAEKFESARSVAFVCSAKCRHAQLFNCVCRKCGKAFEAHHGNSKFCSQECGKSKRNAALLKL